MRHSINDFVISTHALTEGDGPEKRKRQRKRISTHALTEGDTLYHDPIKEEQHFNSRPHGGRHIFSIFFKNLVHYFNSRPHGGRPYQPPFGYPEKEISTHALTEGDQKEVHLFGKGDISTHALTEGDILHIFISLLSVSFQLTPSRRATPVIDCFSSNADISTHALTEGDAIHSLFCFILLISTHALTEGDRKNFSAVQIQLNFNSRPHGGRLPTRRLSLLFSLISTHALTEGDYGLCSSVACQCHFNSRPHGGRRQI